MCFVTARIIRWKFPHDSGASSHKTNIPSLGNHLKNPKTTGHPFRTSQSARTRSYRGFAPVVTLSLMMLLAVSAVGLLPLSSISLRAFPQGQAVAVGQANGRVFVDRVSPPKLAPLRDRLHDLANRLPVQTLDFRHLGDLAASQQPDEGRHVEFRADDLPWRGNPKNLTVKINTPHRGNLAAPGHMRQGFPPNPITSL
jgi:hypothetical protein